MDPRPTTGQNIKGMGTQPVAIISRNLIIMNKKSFLNPSLWLLFAALLCTPLVLTSCGDDDPDTPVTPPSGETTQLTQAQLTGTWKRIHSRGQETKNGTVTDTWDKDVERKQDYFVFYTDGRAVLYDYKDDYRRWVAEASASYTLQDGRAVFATGSLREVRIVSCSGDEMVIVYTLQDDDDPTELKQYTDTLRRTSQRTDQLDIYDPTSEQLTDLYNPNAPEATTLTAAAMQGTWQVTTNKGYTLNKDKVGDRWNRDARGDNEYFIIYPEGSIKLQTFHYQMQAWKVDGQGTFALQDGRATFQSTYFLNLRILSLSGDQITLHYYTQDPYFSYIQDYYTKTLTRVSERTDFLGVKNP